MAKIRIVISIFPVSFLIISNAYSQQCVISDGTLPMNYDGFKKISIYNHNNDLRAFVCDDTEENAFDLIRVPDYQCEWLPFWWGIGPAGQYSLEYYFSQGGMSYAYEVARDVLFYWTWDLDDPGFPYEVDCPGRPVVDLLNNIHVIWEGAGDTIHYGFSTDTLNTFAVEQSLIPPGDFIYLIGSPDNYYIAAIFYNYDEEHIYKYLAEPGESLDLTGNAEIIPFATHLYRAFDITLNFAGNICMVINVPRQFSWGDHYFWSESYGYEFLRTSADDVQDGSNYQIAFGEDSLEMLILDNDFYEHTRFYCSLDGGSTWGISNYEMHGGLYTSATRIFSDTIHMVYCSWYSSYYHPVDKGLIFDDLTDIQGNDANWPRSFALSNYPNPFNAATTISFNLPEAGEVSLAVYDISGRLVNVLLNEIKDAGTHAVAWNGGNSNGQPVSSGVYFYKLSSGDYNETKRLLLLK